MDITPTTTNNTAGTTKSPEADTETPTTIQPTKPLPCTNGVLKRHHLHHHHLHPHHHHHHHLLVAGPPHVVTYKECLKNHAASLGGHALDGCGEFMPSPSADTNDPTSLKCAACGCHRNFHRREPEETLPTAVIEYQPHHRHHPPPPPPPAPPHSRNSTSPPPISSYYPSAPHMVLALSGGGVVSAQPESATPSPNARKRFRTKFSQNQKEKMYEFAERVGWKMQKRDEEMVREFCNEIGVEKGVLKVWMHNNKNTYGKKDFSGNGNSAPATAGNNLPDNNNDDNNHGIFSNNGDNNSGGNVNHYQNESVAHVATNGSSSSS